MNPNSSQSYPKGYQNAMDVNALPFFTSSAPNNIGAPPPPPPPPPPPILPMLNPSLLINPFTIPMPMLFPPSSSSSLIMPNSNPPRSTSSLILPPTAANPRGGVSTSSSQVNSKSPAIHSNPATQPQNIKPSSPKMGLTPPLQHTTGILYSKKSQHWKKNFGPKHPNANKSTEEKDFSHQIISGDRPAPSDQAISLYSTAQANNQMRENPKESMQSKKRKLQSQIQSYNAANIKVSQGGSTAKKVAYEFTRKVDESSVDQNAQRKSLYQQSSTANQSLEIHNASLQTAEISYLSQDFDQSPLALPLSPSNSPRAIVQKETSGASTHQTSSSSSGDLCNASDSSSRLGNTSREAMDGETNGRQSIIMGPGKKNNKGSGGQKKQRSSSDSFNKAGNKGLIPESSSQRTVEATEEAVAKSVKESIVPSFQWTAPNLIQDESDYTQWDRVAWMLNPKQSHVYFIPSVSTDISPEPSQCASNAFMRQEVKGRQVLIKNLPSNVIGIDLERVFSKIGKIEYASHLMDHFGMPTGKAIIRFAENSHALEAIQRFNGGKINEYIISVTMDE